MTRARPAFTLVEVLATLLLLGIVLPVAMRGVSLALTSASTARHTAQAATLAESKLNELIVTGDWAADSSGTFAPEHPEYQWSSQSLERDYGLSEILVRITWTQQGRERSLSISTLASEPNVGVP